MRVAQRNSPSPLNSPTPHSLNPPHSLKSLTSRITRLLPIALLCLPVAACDSARELERSWELAAWSAREVQRGDASELCARFSDEMLTVVSCQALERLLSQVQAAMGEPGDDCRWAYSYRIAALDPLVATSVRSCPFHAGDLSVRVTVRVGREREQVVGLWLDAPEIRGLSLEP